MDILKHLAKGLWRLIRGDPTEGFRIRLQGRDSFLYVEGDRTMTIVGEMQTGKVDFIIYLSSLRRWQPPHEMEEVDEIKRKEILGRLERWMVRRRIDYMLDGEL